MNNVDKVTEYIVGNAGRLAPEKIEALSKVLSALGGEKNQASHEPNSQMVVENQEDLTMPSQLDMSEVQGVQFDDGPRKKVVIRA